MSTTTNSCCHACRCCVSTQPTVSHTHTHTHTHIHTHTYTYTYTHTHTHLIIILVILTAPSLSSPDYGQDTHTPHNHIGHINSPISVLSRLWPTHTHTHTPPHTPPKHNHTNTPHISLSH